MKAVEETGVDHSFKKPHQSKREHWWFKRELLAPMCGRRRIHNVSLRAVWWKPVQRW